MFSGKLKIGVLIIPLVVNIYLIGCVPQQAPSQTSNSRDASILTAVWSVESNCNECHIAQNPDSEGQNTPVAIHRVNSVTCITCHADENELVSTHSDVTLDAKMPTHLMKTSVDSPRLCLECHNLQELQESIVASSVLIDKNEVKISPHDLPNTETHSNRISCVSCHLMHQPLENINKNSMALCISCHHQSVFECNTCHDA
jgi:hypothetical protein